MKRKRDVECPHCGAIFRAGRLACPDCGSDAQTGWQEQEEIDYQALDLDVPGYGEEAAAPRRSRRNRLVALVIVLAMVLALLLAVALR
ncbi:MAG: hypothetical protein HZB39_19970 [Planctomycetes bacterium]|nr:hypothetical protein [Planctomycetota bacterium]